VRVPGVEQVGLRLPALQSRKLPRRIRCDNSLNRHRLTKAGGWPPLPPFWGGGEGGGGNTVKHGLKFHGSAGMDNSRRRARWQADFGARSKAMPLRGSGRASQARLGPPHATQGVHIHKA
jgi:hypothetical protein